jgi:multicomponent Na+:H+ antiporter subunit E
MSSSEEQDTPAALSADRPVTLGSTLSRLAGFFAFWLVLTGADPGDLAAGLLAAVAATWASLRLMPAQLWGLRPVKLARYVLHFLHQSITAGIDVAWRALEPQLGLQPGFVIYQAQLPPGTSREAFFAIMSLMPGTLPCGPAEGDGLMIHCLDVTQPVGEQLAAEEALFVQTIRGLPRNG